MNGHYSLILSLPLILLIVFFTSNIENNEPSNEPITHINSVLGDVSYIEHFGEAPGPEVSDQVRIRVHLEYVEALLRDKPVTHLTDEQIENRHHYLDLLQAYYMAGNFPYNDGHPDERRPTFISEDGNICAVGYLIEQSLGRNVAEKINKEFKYSFLQEIDHPLLRKWAAESGFTMEELAMIQPSYRTYIPEAVTITRNDVNLPFGAGSIVAASANSLYLSNNANTPWLFNSPKINHIFGLVAGSGSVLFGALNLDNKSSFYVSQNSSPCFRRCTFYEVVVHNQARTALATASIGIGVVGVLRAGYHLIKSTQSGNTSNSGLDITTIQLQSAEPIPAL